MINEYVSKEIENIKNPEKYFSASEFEEIKLPEEKKNIFQKAIQWIRAKGNNRAKNNSDNEENAFKPKDKGER